MIKLKKNWWIGFYVVIAGVALWSYFSERLQLAYFSIWPITISNFTLNYLLLMLIWGAAAPSIIFRKLPFAAKWALTLVGFLVLLFVLTLGGLHTRLTDWFNLGTQTWPK